MQCPIDQTTLAMTERQGIEIDYCPTCRGVWLDRGELDKLIESGGEPPRAAQPTAPPREHYQEPPPRRDDRYYSKDDEYKYGKKKKKESFLGDLFDF